MATEARPPADWPEEIRNAFEVLVREGGEVTTAGLGGRIAEAASLICTIDSGQLVAVAALKNPRPTYRTKLRERTGFDLARRKYPYEIGWVYIKPNHRGAGLSRPLVEACLAAAASEGVFASTREDNKPMQRTLKRYGFVQAGNSYKSERDEVTLVLFVREGNAAES